MKSFGLAIKIVFRTFESFLLLATLYFVIGTAYFKNRFGLERMDEAILYTLFWWTEKTTWAPGFSEEKFRVVYPGMKEDEVLKLLGQPLQIVSSCSAEGKERGLITLHYTSQSPICCSRYQ